MKVIFASEQPPGQIARWSGIPYYMAQDIRAAADSFEYVYAPINSQIVKAGGKQLTDDLKKIGQSLSSRAAESDADVIPCQGAAMIPFLETQKPVVLWHDAT